MEQVNHRRRLWNVAPLDALPVKDAPVQRPLSTGERIVSFLGITAQTVWRAIKMEPWLLTEEEMQPRLDICNACVQLVDGHCNLCGCNCQAENGVKFMSKLSHKDASCPMDSPKWGPLP